MSGARKKVQTTEFLDAVAAEARAAALREAIEVIRPMTDWRWWHENHSKKPPTTEAIKLAISAIERLLTEPRP